MAEVSGASESRAWSALEIDQIFGITSMVTDATPNRTRALTSDLHIKGILSSTVSDVETLAQWGTSPPLAKPVSSKPKFEGVVLALQYEAGAETEATGLELCTSPALYC